jgi:hypothetical protein
LNSTYRTNGIGTVIGASLLFASCGASGGGSDDTAGAATLRPVTSKDCAELISTYTAPGVQITLSHTVDSAPATATEAAIPNHCEITGAVDQRIGVDGQSYAIKFRLRVPLDGRWSGRFLFTGGGGSNGNLRNALTAVGALTSPLARGYAIVAQDSGHDNAANNVPMRSGTRSFALDPQARIDNSYRSYDRIASVSKELLKYLSGVFPKKSYFAGCSEGGREAVMVTQRFPEQFDGVIAGAPQLAGPYASLLRPAWITQTYADLARQQNLYDRNGLPFLNKALSDDDLGILAKGVAQSCDALDGVVDGMSQDFRACSAKFDPVNLSCKPGQTADCLPANKVAAIKKQMGGIPGDYSWNYDMGAISGQYRTWWLGASNAVQSLSNMSGEAFVTTYLTPPPIVDLTVNNGSDAYRSLLLFDISRDIGGIYATAPPFNESIWDLTFATGTDLSRFQERGGKMIVYHGVSDGAFTINQTIGWYNSLNENNNGRAQNFAKLYAVPGMGHCGTGPGTSNFELLSVVEDWVERNIAPEDINATADSSTPWPGRTRPLCVYPKVARYKGTGDIEKASSFACLPE